MRLAANPFLTLFAARLKRNSGSTTSSQENAINELVLDRSSIEIEPKDPDDFATSTQRIYRVER